MNSSKLVSAGLLAPVTVWTVTLAAIKLVSGRDWVLQSNRDELPRDPGAYVWVERGSGAAHYVGSGRGSNGIAHRLGNEIGWRDTTIEEIDAGVNPVENEALAWRTPLVRHLAARPDLDAWTLSEGAPSWTTEFKSPITAQEWERFIIEASQILSGRRLVIGGSAWEPSGLGRIADQQAWARIQDLHAQGRI